MTTEPSRADAWGTLQNSIFEIGGQDQLEKLRQEFTQEPTDDEGKKKLQNRLERSIQETHIRIGTLLKTDSVSFLLGAGASKEAGGVLLGTIPLEVERQLLQEGVSNKKVQSWLRIFYLVLCQVGSGGDEVPRDEKQILNRHGQLAKNDNGEKALKINYEIAVSLLYRWRSVIPRDGKKLQVDGPLALEATASDLDDCIEKAKKALADRCVLPVSDVADKAARNYRSFLKKILTRPLNLKRANIFTLNYDTLIEQAADAEGVVLLDGFVGTIRRVFRPESYDQDLYFPADTTEGRVHRLDRVLHLYKLHGSINWTAADPDWANPYGVFISNGTDGNPGTALIYPTPAKAGEALGMPYSELFRRFASAVVRPQSTLFVLGYGFGDEHVNAIIRQALAVPSFTLVIVDPNLPPANAPQSFVGKLRAEKDRRVWLIGGEALGCFSAFVDHVLPDLRDEEILGKVMKTYRALRESSGPAETGGTSDAE